VIEGGRIVQQGKFGELGGSGRPVFPHDVPPDAVKQIIP